jgi:hypothetical protein
MHVFVAHVEHWLNEHGDLESFSNYDIESKNAVNRTVVHHATDRHGGKHHNNKSHIAKQQLHYEFRQRENSLVIPKPMDKNVRKKRQKSRTKEHNKPNKRARTEPKAKTNWASRSAKIVQSEEFDAVYLNVLTEAACYEYLEQFKQSTNLLAKEVADLCDKITHGDSLNNNNNNMDVTE